MDSFLDSNVNYRFVLYSNVDYTFFLLSTCLEFISINKLQYLLQNGSKRSLIYHISNHFCFLFIVIFLWYYCRSHTKNREHLNSLSSKTYETMWNKRNRIKYMFLFSTFPNTWNRYNRWCLPIMTSFFGYINIPSHSLQKVNLKQKLPQVKMKIKVYYQTEIPRLTVRIF